MRLMLVTHGFPPRAVAGVEVYTARLARALRRRGHDVAVLTAAHDLSAPQGAVRWRTDGDGVSVAEVASLHLDGTFRATWDDPGLERAAEEVFRRWSPECVHVQHVQNLSLGVFAAARRAGAAVVLTLHDYWLSCARDGLRMREDLTLCEDVVPDVCARCLAFSPYLTPPLQRALGRAVRRVGLGALAHRVHGAAPGAVTAALRGLRRAAPPAPPDEAEIRARQSAVREALAQVDLFLAPSAFSLARGREAGVPRERSRVEPLCAAVGNERAALPRQGPGTRVAYVGTLAPHKGVHVLIEAFRGLAGEDRRLAIHGNPAVHPEYAAGLARAAEGDGRIRFAGPFVEGTQRHVLAEADVLAVPSVWWENSPLVVQEALAAGVPVVASATGGVPELLGKGGGALVPPGDVGALRRGLEEALAHPPAPATATDAIDVGAERLSVLYAQVRREAPARR